MNNENKKYSPLKYNPLRPSGQSLVEKTNNIFEKMTIHLLWISLVVFMVFNEWIRYYFNTPPNPVVWSFIAIIIIVYFGNKIYRGRKEIENIKLGQYGEEVVGEFLDELREKGYKVFHAVVCESKGKKFDIDHVIVGPGGVFTIEVKTISKKVNQKIFYNGTDIKIAGFSPDRNPILQARSQKDWLENFIKENAKMKVKVMPVILYPGWYVRNENSINSDVQVLNPIIFLIRLNNNKDFLSTDQINLIASHIENYNRKFNL